MKKLVTVIILTFNEEKHIARCIESVKLFASEIIIIDSFSTDSTLEIARSYGIKVFPHEFTNQASQLNWALDNCAIESEWIFRLDADEVATPELVSTLKEKLTAYSNSVTGLTVNRRIYFLGTWIRHGGIYPIATLRIWKTGRGRCEDRLMDEHIVVDGEIQHLTGDISDINLNNLSWWINKHNNYASREAAEILLATTKADKKLLLPETGKQAAKKRWIKETIYSKLPLGLRAFSYFIFRYILRLGFLDGFQGFAFHTLQGLWYRFLVDLKVYEIQKLMRLRGQTLKEVLKTEFGIF